MLKKINIFILVFFLLPLISNASVALTDDFAGTTINTGKWVEYDSVSIGGSSGKVQQNNNLTITGNNSNWSTNGISSQSTFNRSTTLTLQSDFSVTDSGSCAANTCLLIPIGFGNDFNISSASADNLYIKVDMFTNNFSIIRGGASGSAPSAKNISSYTIVQGDKYRVIITIGLSSGATFKLYDLTVDPTMTNDLLLAGGNNVVTGGTFTNGYVFSSAKSALVTTTLYGVTLSAALTAPGAPTNLLTSPSNGQESLSWSAPSDNGGSAITDYLIEYKLTSEPTTWTTFNDGVSTSTTTTITGLTNGQAYNFRVSAINSIGTSVASSTATGTPNPSVPSAPLSLSASSGLSSSSLLSWTSPLSNGGSAITDYLIEYKLTSEPTTWTTFNDGVSTSTTTTITGLTNGQAYNFRVSAINSIGTSVASSTATGTPSLSAPSAPLSLTAQSHKNNQSTITWVAPSSNGGGTISDYLIEYKLTSEPTTWTTFNDGVSTSTTTTVTGLTNDLSYDFRVSAINESGTGSPSVSASAIPGSFVFVDEFSGTTINTSKWTEYDTGGIGGSVGNVQQNNHLTIVGNNTWNVNGLESYTLFDRKKGNIEISTTMSNTSCSLGSTMQFGYGDLNFLGAGSSSYYIQKNINTWTLNYYSNGVIQSGSGVTIPGVSCTDNQNVILKLVVLQTGGAEVYIGSSLTPAVTLSGGTFTNKPIWVQSRASTYVTTFSLVTVKGNISGPEAPQDLIPTVNYDVINLNWSIPANNNSPIIDYIIEYKLTSEPTTWTTFNDGISTNNFVSISGLTTGVPYDFRVTALNINATGDVSSIVSATPLSGVPTAPTANTVAISGSYSVGEKVLGSYIYNDVNGDRESSSLYQWFRSDSLNGSYSAIAGATSIIYQITLDDLNKYIKFEVIPIASVIPTNGGPVFSQPIGPISVVNYFNHFVLTGQSLAIGYGGTPVLSNSQPYNNKMLSGSEENGTNLIPLVELMRETIRSGLANNLTAFSPTGDFQSSVSLSAIGNTAYSGLKKGTDTYNKALLQITNIFNAAKNDLSKTDRVSGIAVIHGEKDHFDGTSASLYESYLAEWQRDYEADAKAITGQTNDVPLFTDQMSSFTGYGSATSVIPGAQLSASENYPGKIFLVGPKYFFNYNDYAHLTNTSYRWLGEYYAKVIKKVVIDRESWRPLSPDSIVRSSNIIYAKFHVPAGKLAFDTTTVSQRQNYGFEYSDSTSSASISSVDILGDDFVKITLSNVPTGYSQKLRYAFTGVAGSDPGAQQSGSAAGNLRDTDPTVALSGNPLYDWTVSFEKSIMPANDTTLPVISNFSIPSTSSSLNISINNFQATDNLSVIGYKITESSSSPNVNDSGWTTTAPTSYTFDTEGSKTLYAWVKDAAGNISLSSQDSIQVDLSIPVISEFIIPSHSLSLFTNITSFKATDNFSIAGYLVNESSSEPSLDDPSWSIEAPTSYTFDTEGSKTLYAWVKDSVGNVSLSSNANVIVNLTATAYTFSGPAFGNVNSNTSNFIITPNNPYTGTITITPSGVGSSGLSAVVLTFSNSSEPQTVSFRPLTSGSIVFTPTNNTGITNPSNINFTANAVAPNAPTLVTAISGDASSLVSFVVPESNGGSFITGYTVTSIPSGGVDTDAGTTKTTHTITNLLNGTSYVFTVRATNTVGQGIVSLESNSIIPNDTTAPTITAFSIPSTSESLTININDFTAVDANGVVGYKITESSSSPLAGGFGWSLTPPLTYTFSSSGTKTLYAWTKDSSGNVSSSFSAQTTILVINSNYNFTGPTSGEVNSPSTSFTVSPVNPYTGTITITPSGSGSTGLTPIVLTFSNSSESQTFTITPQSVGLLTLIPTNSGTLINPSNISYTVNEIFVPDNTAPVISSVLSVPSSSSTFIIWKTDDLSSSKINYGLDDNYGLNTTVLDTSPGVVNHIILVSNLASCTRYHYKIYSENSFHLYSQTSDDTFTTSGCVGGSTIKDESSNKISISSGGNINLVSEEQTVGLVVPANFGKEDANFQIKKLDKNDTIKSTSVPLGYLNVGSYVYDIKALDQNLNTITTFDYPLTVSMTYTSLDISDRLESSLSIYRWDGLDWNILTNCITNTSLKNVTCNTNHFSVFGLFGQKVVSTNNNTPVVSSGGGGGGGSVTYGCTDKNALNYMPFVVNNKSLCKYKEEVVSVPVLDKVGVTVPKDSKYKFNHNLKLGMKGDDVKKLQQYLNNKGFIVSKTGIGSKGKENTKFGQATKSALIRFQKANGIKPASGVFGPITRWTINS